MTHSIYYVALNDCLTYYLKIKEESFIKTYLDLINSGVYDNRLTKSEKQGLIKRIEKILLLI